MSEMLITPGKIYHNGKGKRRYVLGYMGYMVVYINPDAKKSSRRTGIPIWDFKKWAKGIDGEDGTA